jgi:pimeloyl-ACP methyl ester carboxylesterase
MGEALIAVGWSISMCEGDDARAFGVRFHSRFFCRCCLSSVGLWHMCLHDKGHFMRRPVRLIAIAMCCGSWLSFAAAPAPAWAQAAATKPGTSSTKKTWEDKTLVTKDNASLKATYFPSAVGKDAAVVILMHGKGGNRLVWNTAIGKSPGFATVLQQQGFAVLTIDLRFHGDSQPEGAAGKSGKSNLKNRDYQAMVVGDLEAAKEFLMGEHAAEKLNIAKLGLVGAEFSTAVAMAYTELDWSKKPFDDNPNPALRTPRGQDVKALVLLSPDDGVPGLPVSSPGKVIRALQTNAKSFKVMLAAGAKDPFDKGSAKKLADTLGYKPIEKGTDLAQIHVFFEAYDVQLRGTDLLNPQLKTQGQMLTFLVEYLAKLDEPWRSRKSVLLD